MLKQSKLDYNSCCLTEVEELEGVTVELLVVCIFIFFVFSAFPFTGYFSIYLCKGRVSEEEEMGAWWDDERNAAKSSQVKWLWSAKRKRKKSRDLEKDWKKKFKWLASLKSHLLNHAKHVAIYFQGSSDDDLQLPRPFDYARSYSKGGEENRFGSICFQ